MKGRAYKKVCPEKARPEENLRGQRQSRVPVGLSSNSRLFLSSARKKKCEKGITLFDFSHCAESVAEKGEFARLFKGVPLHIAQRGKKRRRAAARRTSVVPSNHDFFFCQLKRKSVNPVSRQIAAVSFGEICVRSKISAQAKPRF